MSELVYRSGDCIVFEGEQVARLNPNSLPTLVDRFIDTIESGTSPKARMTDSTRAEKIRLVLELLDQEQEAGLVSLEQVSEAMGAVL